VIFAVSGESLMVVFLGLDFWRGRGGKRGESKLKILTSEVGLDVM